MPFHSPFAVMQSCAIRTLRLACAVHPCLCHVTTFVMSLLWDVNKRASTSEYYFIGRPVPSRPIRASRLDAADVLDIRHSQDAPNLFPGHLICYLLFFEQLSRAWNAAMQSMRTYGAQARDVSCFIRVVAHVIHSPSGGGLWTSAPANLSTLWIVVVAIIGDGNSWAGDRGRCKLLVAHMTHTQ